MTTLIHYTRSTATACKVADSVLLTRDRLVTCPACLDSIARELLRRSRQALEHAGATPA